MENAGELGASSSRQLRHRRRAGRSQREQTPDASRPSSLVIQSGLDQDDYGAQHVSMQIRPPGAMSAHESKILRRRDKAFAGVAARSQSQPREAEKLSSPDANHLIKHRSLSSPRHKDESSESELTGSSQSYTAQQQQRAQDSLSRLEQNLQRFEGERRRFETEKRLFEREKREHKLRHRQQLDHEERKRLLQSYRKISDSFQLPQDEDERRRLVQSLRLQRHEVPAVRLRNRSSGYDESSTQFSSSDADTAEEQLTRQKPAVRKATVSLPIRGAPPPPPNGTQQAPLKPPERASVSRNNSLSPVRPQRRSKTPEQRERQEIKRKMEYVEVGETPNEIVVNPKRTEEEQRTELRRAYVEAAEKAAIAEAALAKSLGTFSVDKVKRSHSLRMPDKDQEKPKPDTKRSSSLERPQRAKRTSSLERPKKVEDVQAIPASNEEEPQAVEIKPEVETIPTTTEEKLSLLRRLGNLFRSKPKHIEEQRSVITLEQPEPAKLLSRAFLHRLRLEAVHEWRRLKLDYPVRMAETRRLRNECVSHSILLILLLGFGGLLFRYTEGMSENIYKCEVRKVKRDFIDNLWAVSHNMREDDWKSLARHKLRNFEDELNTLAELGLRRFPGQKSFNFVNCIIYCWTVITTIGYGHITPKTTVGRSLTIIYAIIGIPMFLIVLADLGKLFTRSVKFLWAYVRRVYYTRSCRQIRKQQQIRDAMTGINTVYDMAIRRPSMFFGMSDVPADEESQDAEAGKSGTSHPETPTSPYPETFEVDDEFNLPVSVASMLLIAYIVLGSVGYTFIETSWSYLDAFYFVFISMSTIGFGDLVPGNPFYVMVSMIYLIFGLALTSMFINVVQIKLSDHFKRASAKVGATIGMGVASEFGDEFGSQVKIPSELASVHGSRLGPIEEDGHEAPSPQPPLTSILRAPRPQSPTSLPGEPAANSEDTPPPLMPKRQLDPQQQPTPTSSEKKKKYRFF
ncbi:uncharacterized protein LOC6559471 isoform X1 [Drosophila grimshawi]|uniref:GH20716 n=1 Tax=Drosophila grimshawi TaxID=7222 RepID=B4J6R9_DROGR|nr:uncharacterized protein LOC6559471 isoform X1 [Drosophila grimshawi]EDW00972.1 GH20716 [Drosophila grimshawi]